MSSSARRQRPLRSGPPLTAQVCGVLLVGALLLSLAVTLVTAERSERERAAEQHARHEATCSSLASRAAPLLERADDLRLSVLAASVADIAACRVLLLDAAGVVRIDTGLALGGRRLELESQDGPISREIDEGRHEVLFPALGTDGFAGEVRIRYELAGMQLAAFPWSLFGLVLLCSLSLTAVACWMVHAWVGRVRAVTVDAQRLARGETTATHPVRGREGTVDALHDAMLELSARADSSEALARSAYLRLARELVHALEIRGHVPVGHPERTRRWVARLADAAGIPDAQRQLAVEAAELLDLGKSGVRPGALEKDGPLDEVERESLRQHPIRGARLLSGLDSLRGVALAIRHQHETWSGTGFPSGLRGDRIPLASRMLAIASAFDLLTAGGPRFAPMSWPDALDRMREDRGELFDPELLDCFEADVRRDPPQAPRDRDLVISAEGVLPYRAVHEQQPVDEPAFAEDDAEEILALGGLDLEWMREDLSSDDDA